MLKEEFPARIHILLASKSDKAIIIRCGPSKQTCIIGWDRKHNIFEVTQWLKGRIYERRSDISPSGQYWIYFAMNGKWSSEVKGAWTAVARVPWLKAVTLFAKGDCWNGGGLFINDRSYWLNDGYGHDVIYDNQEVVRDKKYQPSKQYGGECLHVYYNKLQREGWVLKQTLENDRWHVDSIFEKEILNGWILRKICHAQTGSPPGKGCYWDEHELINHSEESFLKPDWGWADWADGVIYFAEKGCLYQLDILDAQLLAEPKLLHDFNHYKFENKEAPY